MIRVFENKEENNERHLEETQSFQETGCFEWMQRCKDTQRFKETRPSASKPRSAPKSTSGGDERDDGKSLAKSFVVTQNVTLVSLS
jgi:hypothetical protein